MRIPSLAGVDMGSSSADANLSLLTVAGTGLSNPECAHGWYTPPLRTRPKPGTHAAALPKHGNSV